ITDTGFGAAITAAGILSARRASAQDWNGGSLSHIIPTANHERFLIKTSFGVPLNGTPTLSIDGRSTAGQPTAAAGRFWRFDVSKLAPDTEYELRIVGGDAVPLCDPWPLKTLPAPGSQPARLRILSYTCGGGFDGPPLKGKTFFLDMTARRRL